jgi:hypothetical protein
MVNSMVTCCLLFVMWLQGEGAPEISKREKARLREMQKMKKQKVQEILDAQNAAIEADMVSLVVILHF